MYLEERVEQLEALAIDQSKQSETIAKAVAKLTVDTQQGINELKQGQAELRQEVTRLADLSDATNERITQLDRKIDQRYNQLDKKIDQQYDQLNTRMIQLETNQVEMRQDIAELKVGQELILQILREKLS